VHETKPVLTNGVSRGDDILSHITAVPSAQAGLNYSVPGWEVRPAIITI
jgi:hypothetical protein